MTPKNLVTEVNGWDYRTPGTVPDYPTLAQTNLGVIVKVSQGMTWVATYAQKATQAANAAGLLIGALHYAEPTPLNAEDEATMFLGNLPPVPFGLGVWLELDNLGELPPHMAKQWADQFGAVCGNHGLDLWVLASTELVNTAPGLVEGARWVKVDQSPDNAQPYSAQRMTPASDTTGNPKPTQYRILDTRSLNPPAAVVDTPGATEPEKGTDEATEADTAPLVPPAAPETPTEPETEPPPPEVTGPPADEVPTAKPDPAPVSP